MNLHNFNSNTKSWKMYTNTLTSISGDNLLVMPSYGKDIILEVSANNDIFFKKGTITKRFDNLVSDYLETSFNSLNSQVQYILQEISGNSVKDFITSGISNDLLIKSYDGRDIILEVSGNSEIIFKRGDFSYNLDDLIGGGGSQSSDYATYNILDITGKIIFTDNSNTSGTSGTSGSSGSSSNIVLTSISGNIIPSINNTFKLGDVSKNWSNAYITDVSAINIDVSGNLNPLIANSSSLGSTLKPWGNAYIIDVSATNISVSENIILNICGGTITNINKLTAPASNYKITSTTRLYQEISGDISWNAVNGYYGLAKDAYPGLNPYSSGAKAVSNWTGRSQGVELNSWRTVCWSPELRIFVAVTNNGDNRVMTSTNGTSWTSISDGVGSNQWSSVCWSAELGIFVAVSYGNVMTSATGTSWTSISDDILNGEESNSWTSVCWSAELGIFVAVAFGCVMTSANGTSWTSISDGVQGNNWDSVCWSAELGIFVAVAYNGVNRIMTSANGTSWTSTSDGIEINAWTSVCWSAELGIFVAVAYNGDNRVMTSANGTSWTSTSDGVDLNAWNSVCWSAELGIFVAVARGGDNRVMYSANGTSWTSTSDGVDLNAWNSVCWSAELGIFVAVAIFGEESDIRVMTSSLKGRPPTSYNVFDSTSNSIDENGMWTFSNISIVDNLVPVNDNYSNLGLDTNRWNNAYINALNVTETVTFGGSNLYVPSSFTIDPLGHGDNTGTVTINGNLVVQGVTTTINSSVVDISDKMIVLASNASNSLQADGAGFEISGAKVNFLYDNTSATFRSSIGISISGNVVPVTNSVGSLGETGKNWSNAYIRDVSVTNIEVSGNIVPLRDISSNLGSSLNRWNNVFVNDLSVNTINGQAYSASEGTSNIFTTSIKDISSIINVAQVGQDISAGSSSTTRSDWFGRQVAMSGNGECIIIASPYKVVSGLNGVGSIITYRYDVSNSEFNNNRETTNPVENSTNTWRQYAQAITSPTVQEGVYFGWRVAISHNGKMIAVASRGTQSTIIYIAEFGINYTFPGMILWGGQTIISAGGEKVIIQPHIDPSFIIISNIANAGYVEVYNSNSNKTTWTRVGLRLTASTATVPGKITEYTDICISGDAKTIAYTVAPNNWMLPEYVVICSLSGTSSVNWTWNQIATITRTTEIVQYMAGYGMSIAMSYDGLTLAINEPGVILNSTLKLFGRVKVYRYTNSSWTQLGISGSYISSTYRNLIFGSKISLSPEGNILTVASPTERFLPDNTFGILNIRPIDYVHAIMIYIYDALSNTWIKQGPDIIKTNDTILGPGIYEVWQNQKLFSSLTVSSYLFGSSYSNNPVFRIAVGSWNSDAAVAQTNSRIFVRSYQYTITNSKKQSLLKFNAETTEIGTITISGDLIPNVSPIIAMFPIGVLNFWGPRYGCNIGSTQYRWNTIWSYYMDAFLGSFTCILTTSDDRLKHNEVIINNGLDIIDQLTPKFYQKTQELLDAHYNGDLSGHNWTYETGLIAQELLQIKDLSFVVSGGDYYDTNNFLITQPYSVNYNNVFVYGLAAIKELHQKVKAQETSISTLQTSMLEQQATINSLLTRLQALEARAN